MSTAKITLFSFAHWMNQNNDDLFANLSVPEGIDRLTLIDNILLRGGEFEVVYSDPNFMQYAIGSWSRKWYRTMQKWIDALSIKYSPLENYDRFEHWEDNTDRDTGNAGVSGSETVGKQDNKNITTDSDVNVRTHDNSDVRTNDNTDTTIHDNTDIRTHDNTDQRTHDYEDSTAIASTVNDNINEDDTKETKVSAFDSDDYQPSQYEDASHDGDNTRTEATDNIATHTGTITDDHTGTITDAHSGTVTDEHTGTITDAHTGTITDENVRSITDESNGGNSSEFNETHADNGFENTDFIHDGRIHGNVGVTTSQQMLQAELDISAWNIYEHITDLFLNEFVIPIYT